MYKLTIAGLAALAATSAATAQWSLVSPTTPPSARQNAAMAYDSSRMNSVLFGGADQFGLNELDQTWTYNGSWSQQSPATSPGGRQYVRMAFDSGRNVTVLFGGLVAQGSGHVPLGGHWEWNGANWSQVTTATVPSNRGRQGIAYDSARGRLVMYGGSTGAGFAPTLADTWEYDGSDWTQISTVNSPGEREGAAMCYHAASGKTVLFSGFRTNDPNGFGPIDDTWVYDGSDWTRLTFAGTTPPPRSDAQMVYDPIRKVCILYGGHTAYINSLDDTWEFDGTSWEQATSGTPAGRAEHAMAFDANLKRAVVFGGTMNRAASIEIDETWEYGADAGYQTFGAGCPGSLGTPTLSSTLPQLGSPWTVSVSNAGAPATLYFGTSTNTWAGLPLPIDLFLLGSAGCKILVSWDIGVGMGPSASVTFTLPTTGALMGAQLHNQALILESTRQGFRLVVSNAGTATFGY